MTKGLNKIYSEFCILELQYVFRKLVVREDVKKIGMDVIALHKKILEGEVDSQIIMAGMEKLYRKIYSTKASRLRDLRGRDLVYWAIPLWCSRLGSLPIFAQSARTILDDDDFTISRQNQQFLELCKSSKGHQEGSNGVL